MRAGADVTRRGIQTIALIELLAAGVLLTACGDSPTPSADETPLAAAQSWFGSINAKDLQAAQDHFVPSARDQMDWGGGDTATWSTFTNVHCRSVWQTATAATVHCTFLESASPSEGNPDTYWTIDLVRSRSGQWLIDNYGQP